MKVSNFLQSFNGHLAASRHFRFFWIKGHELYFDHLFICRKRTNLITFKKIFRFFRGIQGLRTKLSLTVDKFRQRIQPTDSEKEKISLNQEQVKSFYLLWFGPCFALCHIKWRPLTDESWSLSTSAFLFVVYWICGRLFRLHSVHFFIQFPAIIGICSTSALPVVCCLVSA